MRDLTRILFLTSALTFVGATDISRAEDAAMTQAPAQEKLVEKYRLTRLEITDQGGDITFRLKAISVPDDEGDATGSNMRTQLNMTLLDASANGSFGNHVADPRVQLVSCDFLNEGVNDLANVKMIINTSDASNVRSLFNVQPAPMSDAAPFDVNEIILEGQGIEVVINGDVQANNSKSTASSVIGNTRPLVIKGVKNEFGKRSFKIDFARTTRTLQPSDGLVREPGQKQERLIPR